MVFSGWGKEVRLLRNWVVGRLRMVIIIGDGDCRRGEWDWFGSWELNVIVWTSEVPRYLPRHLLGLRL